MAHICLQFERSWHSGPLDKDLLCELEASLLKKKISLGEHPRLESPSEMCFLNAVFPFFQLDIKFSLRPKKKDTIEFHSRGCHNGTVTIGQEGLGTIGLNKMNYLGSGVTFLIGMGLI